jgi:hypothetical protein
MVITRSITEHGSFAPTAVNYLRNIPEQYLFYKVQGLRHPAGTYSVSLGKVGEAFNKVAEEYLRKTDELRYANGAPHDVTKLLELQDQFLHALQEHLDDYYLILKAFINPATALKHPIFNEKYVLENKLPGAKTFQTSIEGFRTRNQITNHLKHQQGRLRSVAVWPPAAAHLGYFLEEPDKGGVIAPSKSIHPDQGAFSFASDLPRRMFDVYTGSESLVNAVRKVLNALHGGELVFSKDQRESVWDAVAYNASKIPVAVFPKEAPKGIATYRLEGDSKLIITYPEKLKISFPRPLKASTETKGDGYSTSFKFPLP